MNNDQSQDFFFSPVLYVKNVGAAIDFYVRAFNAIELRSWGNSDGSIRAAELSVGNALFHLHEEAAQHNEHFCCSWFVCS